MKVICAGLSKTGTKSIAKALRALGYTVYDFMEHVQYHSNEWLDIYRLGKSPDFASMYQGVDAVTDLPAAFWYEEIFEAFPDAKVVLSIRDNDEVWAQSFTKHVERRNQFDRNILMNLMMRFSKHRNLTTLGHAVDTAAYGSLKSEPTVLFKKKYREHNQRVQFVIPKEKLLIFNVKQGWKPLCEFLGYDVPEQAFPRENVAGSFGKEDLAKRLLNFEIFISLVVLLFLVGVFYFVY